MTPRYRHYTTLKNFKTPMPTAVIWNKTYNFALRTQGKMLEWLKRHAWKACIRQKRIGGSNPPLSALLRLFPGFRTGSPWQFTFSKLHFPSHHILQYRYPSAA